MKIILLSAALLVSGLLRGQTNGDEVTMFITLFKSELAKLHIGKIEEHYDSGYFKTLEESEYFDKGLEVGLTSIYQRCAGKDEAAQKQEIANYFLQAANLNKERKTFEIKMEDYPFIKPYLKIRIYSAGLLAQFESNQAIVKTTNKGFMEVVVFDLPSAVGSVNKKYLTTWGKSENDIYQLAKDNTLNSISLQFEKEQPGKNGEEYYLLSSDTDIFITSAILELKKTNLPVGKYGTLVSIPSTIAVIALPLDDSSKIKLFSLALMGLTDYMYENQQTKPICNNLFWYNGQQLLPIEKDIEKKEFLYPDQLRKFITN